MRDNGGGGGAEHAREVCVERVGAGWEHLQPVVVQRVVMMVVCVGPVRERILCLARVPHLVREGRRQPAHRERGEKQEGGEGAEAGHGSNVDAAGREMVSAGSDL